MPEATNPPAPDPKDKGEKTDDAPDDVLKLTKDELEQRIADALKADREKRKKKERKQREADDEGDEDEEDPADIIRKAETRAATAEQERDQAKKEALLAKVENKLRDYLALNFRDLIGNAPDIMLHIERALGPDAKDGEVARLIESHSKAFAERTKAVRKPASGAPPGGARSRGLTDGAAENETDRRVAAAAAAQPAPTARRWGTINFHG